MGWYVLYRGWHCVEGLNVTNFLVQALAMQNLGCIQHHSAMSIQVMICATRNFFQSDPATTPLIPCVDTCGDMFFLPLPEARRIWKTSWQLYEDDGVHVLTLQASGFLQQWLCGCKFTPFPFRDTPLSRRLKRTRKPFGNSSVFYVLLYLFGFRTLNALCRITCENWIVLCMQRSGPQKDLYFFPL